jgi:alanyl-tRNA synthetase
VRPDKLRFDFTHPQALTADEREEVERRVNERVFENLPVRTFETPIEEARTLGAMMLFGEKYGDVVRVVDIGGWSIELCGGTHVRSTAEIGPFVVLAESSVGSGARRIEAVTSGEAFALLHERAREADDLRGELERARKEKPKQQAEASYIVSERVDGVVLAETKGMQPGPLRDLSDRIRQQEKADGAIVASITDGRVHIVVNVAESVGVDAAAIANEMGQIVGGRGGGKPTMAQAGGNAPDEIPSAFAAAKKALA